MNSRRATRAPSNGHACAACRRRFAAFGLSAAFAVAAAGICSARAAEFEASECLSFCAPLASTQLENYRAQGLTAPPGSDTKLSVILWDEYRRTRQPRGANETVSARVSYAPTAH